ncbi:MAG: hypothetical protein EON92_05840 [Burkholderiales bacterium]|nr:MAG: hypothetical protein EON92_05840 [Burkholderiales bacterium]
MLKMTLLAMLAAVIFAHSTTARAMQAMETSTMLLQSGSPAAAQSRYDLGAVVDVRKSSDDGNAVLAVTPGAAAERIGLRAGDRVMAINGRRLDHPTAKPSAALESALQEGRGALRVEVTRDGKPLLLSGRADLVRANSANSCGYVTDRAGVVPRNQGIFQVDITQIEGRSTPLQPTHRHRVDAGKRVLVVRELIPQNYLNSAQLAQIAKMKKFAFARAYKSLVVDVNPGMSYRIGARLLRDKLDTQSIRDNAYWVPVVWEVVPESCP